MSRPVNLVRAVGPEQAPPVVLFHGMGLGRWIWGRTQQALAEGGITSFAYDLPGHGDAPSNPSLDQAIDEVEAVIRAVPGCSVVGHSVGGYLSQVAVTRARVNALVLVGAFPTAAVRLVPTRDQLRSSLRHTPAAALGRTFSLRYDDYHRCGFDKLPEEDARSAFARITPWPGRLVRRLAFQPHHVDREGIGAPVLCVIGRQDRVVRWQVGRALGEHFDALIWRYDDLGHFPMLQPEGARFDQDLVGWLKNPRGRKVR